jgi:hypothetical protein
MNDQFLYELRQAPSVEFADRLKCRLDHRSTSRRSPVGAFILTSLFVGATFAYIYKSNKHHNVQTALAPAPQWRVTPPAVPVSSDVRAPTAPLLTAPPTESQTQSGLNTTSKPPAHWFISGRRLSEAPGHYVGEIDHAIAYEGSGSGLLRSISAEAQHGTLMQSAAAGPYQGKRIQFAAFLRSRKVTQRAGLWIRAEDANGLVVAFRNILSPESPLSYVSNETDWKEAKVSVDIPPAAKTLFYGVQLLGTGSIWIDNVRFDIVGNSEPIDDQRLPLMSNPSVGPAHVPPAPQNLDFEE